MVALHHFMNARRKKKQSVHFQEVKNFLKRQPNKQIKGYQIFTVAVIYFQMLGQNFKQTLWRTSLNKRKKNDMLSE